MSTLLKSHGPEQEPAKPRALQEEIERSLYRLGGYLLARQVVFDSRVGDLRELDGVPATHDGRVFEARRSVADGNRAKVGLSGDAGVDGGAAATLLRLKREQAVRLGLRSKVRRYLLADRPHKWRRLAGYAKGRLREPAYDPIRQPTPCRDHEWAMHAGVNLRRNGAGLYECIDHGGIYETRLTTRAMRYPSQVGADLYTSSCAAYVFHHLWQRTGEPGWQRSLERLRAYFARYFAYPRQRLETDHREFDFAPVFLALGEDAAAPFRGWAKYDPVNVFGLRLYNLSLAGVRTRGDAIRLRIAREAVRSAQTGDGLIRDNMRGGCVDSGDATYHHYCLAMLCLANERLNDEGIERMIDAGTAFSAGMQLADGEVAYYGRAANNVYHLASWITALAYAVGRRKQYALPLLERSLRLLLAHQRSDGAWSTALNGCEPEEMIGWHGSESQYSALAGFLLGEASRLLAAAPEPRPGEPERCRTSRETAVTGKHCVLRDDDLEAALTAGGDLTPWVQGTHESGHPGLTALVWKGRNVLLTNDWLRRGAPNGLRVGDIQRVDRKGGAVLAGTAREATVNVGGDAYRYRIAADGLSVRWSLAGGHSVYGMPVAGRPEVLSWEPGRMKLALDGGIVLAIEFDPAGEAELVPVELNPRGEGTLIRFTSPDAGGWLRCSFARRSGSTHPGGG